jgi:sulfofructosephosphate aldolase
MRRQPMTPTGQPDLSKLAGPSGALMMVAIDQRESLRTMFAAARGGAVSDSLIVDFKVAVAECLAPHASAMLFDRHFGMPAFEAAAIAAPGCGRIVAADALVQEPGGPVVSSDIDLEVDPTEARRRGAAALKLLLIWRGPDNSARCLDTALRFMDRCRKSGLVGIVEGIVRPQDPSQREAALVDAARSLAAAKPDLYKCEVPFAGKADDTAIARVCEQVSAVLPCPWVVLSQGVEIPEFPRAVEIACRSGASGFLAGRAVWADTLAHEDYRTKLGSVSVPRLQRLVEIVEKSARPWHSAAAGATSAPAFVPKN